MMHGYCSICRELRRDMSPAEHAQFLVDHDECAVFAEIVSDLEGVGT